MLIWRDFQSTGIKCIYWITEKYINCNPDYNNAAEMTMHNCRGQGRKGQAVLLGFPQSLASCCEKHKSHGEAMHKCSSQQPQLSWASESHHPGKETREWRSLQTIPVPTIVSLLNCASRHYDVETGFAVKDTHSKSRLSTLLIPKKSLPLEFMRSNL